MKTKTAKASGTTETRNTPPKKAPSNGNGNGNGHTHVDTEVLEVETLAPPADGLNTRELLRVLTEVKNGNFSVRMPIDEVGISGKIFDTLNEVISLNEKMMTEFTRAGNTIGKQGKLTQRIEDLA